MWAKRECLFLLAAQSTENADSMRARLITFEILLSIQQSGFGFMRGGEGGEGGGGGRGGGGGVDFSLRTGSPWVLWLPM